ncbi:MAG: IS4 family transposase, partial [Anaerolineales bacterium]|nr:IS4 family transposase [Anaerolineales bacterium]
MRFTTETLFSDLKGRGFHLDDTRLWQPERLHRLLLAAAIAYFL